MWVKVGLTFLTEALGHHAALSPKQPSARTPVLGLPPRQMLQENRWPFTCQVSPGTLLSLTLSKMDSPLNTHPVFRSSLTSWIEAYAGGLAGWSWRATPAVVSGNRPQPSAPPPLLPASLVSHLPTLLFPWPSFTASTCGWGGPDHLLDPGGWGASGIPPNDFCLMVLCVEEPWIPESR